VSNHLYATGMLDMIGAICLILCCYLLGEVIVIALYLPISGAIAGFILMLFGLLIHGGIPENLEKVAGVFTANLSLFFVPAGVGVIVHMGLIGNDWLLISIALLFSTMAAIAVNGLLMTWFNRRSAIALMEADSCKKPAKSGAD
jgi:holin-like protein